MSRESVVSRRSQLNNSEDTREDNDLILSLVLSYTWSSVLDILLVASLSYCFENCFACVHYLQLN